jgi:hypothetical protein
MCHWSEYDLDNVYHLWLWLTINVTNYHTLPHVEDCMRRSIKQLLHQSSAACSKVGFLLMYLHSCVFFPEQRFTFGLYDLSYFIAFDMISRNTLRFRRGWDERHVRPAFESTWKLLSS